MGKILDKVKRLVSRPGDAKYHADGLEYVDPKVIEVPLKLLQRHQNTSDYIRAYVQSELKLAQLKAEHESLEDALDFDIEGDGDFADRMSAAELEAEELARMAQDDYTLRRHKAIIDKDRQLKSYRKGEALQTPAPKGTGEVVAGGPPSTKENIPLKE